MRFIIFFTVFFLLYGLVNYYIFIRGQQSIPADSTLRNSYAIAFWIVALSFIGGRVLERFWISALTDLLIWLGSFWIAAMLYFLLAVLLLDLLRLIGFFLPIFPPVVREHWDQAKYFAAAAAICVVAGLLIAGHVNSMVPRVRILDLAITKKAAGLRSLNIVAASDIHLGTIVGRSRLDWLVGKINSMNPDLVLLPGDIVDEDLAPVVRQNLGEGLRNIRSRFGVYAVTGNHEYIGGVEKACAYLTDHNVVMLRDQVITVAGMLVLVGREDRSCLQFNGKQRMPLEALMAAVDRRYPVVLMDHQPFGLNEAASQGVDLQLSGHTHQGQLWPVNYIVRAIYELGWGYGKRGDTHLYISNGLGTWGPPVRIGNRPEIVHIRLMFQ